tara:strand:+ start:41 stop:952 length:912 start_codon:yes stop_codon:yes gene_type:complete
MEDTSKYIATVSSSSTNEITNNAEILINNVKILIKFLEEAEEFHITKNHIINIEYNNHKTQLKIIYYNNKIVNTLFILFDQQSQSAYESIVQNIKEFSKVKGILYYESGNLKMEGEFILDEESGRYSANGNAKVYYDNPDKQMYYEGEIENENYDGSGIFYNKQGNISLKVNNIDQNNPIGIGLLTIKDFSNDIYYKKEFSFDRIIDIDFSEFELNNFIESNNDNDLIFDDLENYSSFKHHYSIDTKVTNELESQSDISNDKKYEIFYRKILELELKMNQMMTMINEIHTKITTEPKRTGFFG